MSAQLQLPGFEGGQPVEVRPAAAELRAMLHREMRFLLTINTKAGGVGRVSPSGLAHSLGVCLIEDWHMARGKGKAGNPGNAASMPRFVDVKLDAAQKQEFMSTSYSPIEIVSGLQRLADDGYRVGCAWSGEHQTYTVSLTCRDEGSPNNGKCMTSFARELSTAVALALFKHDVVTKGVWIDEAQDAFGEFG